MKTTNQRARHTAAANTLYPPPPPLLGPIAAKASAAA